MSEMLADIDVAIDHEWDETTMISCPTV